MIKSKLKSYFTFIIIFIFFVLLPIIFFTKGMKFQTGGDSISYIVQAESLYYDHDFLYDKKDALRFTEKYEKYLSIKNLRIITKKTKDNKIVFAKPIFFTAYLALFTDIKDPITRIIIANLIFVFLIYLLSYGIIKEKKLFLIFCTLSFFSQMNFYIPIIHPEVSMNFLVLISSLPLFFEKRKNFLYLISGFSAGLLIFSKQLAIVFPIVVLGYLFFKNKKGLYFYFASLFFSCVLMIGLNFIFHGDLLVYQGLRGAAVYDGSTINFSPRGVIKPFTFPLAYWQRFIEYFFGKNIGIFIYNTPLLLFICCFFYFLTLLKNKNKRNQVIEFIVFSLPVFLYLGGYFIFVDPLYSYGGSTSLGNRYFFQIYLYVLIVLALFLKEVFKEKNNYKRISIIVLIVTVVFSFFIYQPFYQHFKRATQDHLKIVFQKKIFRLFPMELSYAEVIFQDLTGANKIDNRIYVINGAVSVEKNEQGIVLPSGKTEIVEISDSPDFKLLKVMKNVRVVKKYKLNFLINKTHYLGLFEITCFEKENCLLK